MTLIDFFKLNAKTHYKISIVPPSFPFLKARRLFLFKIAMAHCCKNDEQSINLEIKKEISMIKLKEVF